MPTEEIKHSDNTRVSRSQYGCEYFAVSMFPREEGYRPYEVSIYRYCVPGRCDTYCFDWELGSPRRLRYFSEAHTPLSKMLALLAKDLDKPQVVELLVEAVTPEKHMHYSRQLIDQLLYCLAPKSKSYRACKRAFDKMLAARTARFETQRITEQKVSE